VRWRLPKDEEFVKKSVSLHRQELKKYEIFARENNIEYIDSYTNFITYILPKNLNSTKISDDLFKEGIIIRNLASYGMNGVRITIGTAKQNERFFKIFTRIIS